MTSSRQRRLLLISYHFPPSSEVAGKPTARLVRHLPKYGWEPVVMTIPAANALAPLDGDAYAELLDTRRIDRIAPWPHMIDAVVAARSVARRAVGWCRRRLSVHSGGTAESATTPTVVQRRRQSPNFLVRYARYPDLQAGWVIPAVLHARRLLRRERFDAVMTVAPPHSVQLVGLALHRYCPSIPWVAQMHDPWTGNPFANPEDRFQRRVSRYFEKTVVRSADLVLLATEEAAATYENRYPGQQQKFGTLHNGFDPLDFPVDHAPGPNFDGPIRFVYAGALYRTRDPYPFLRGIANLILRGVIRPDEIQVDFVGDCEFAGARPIRPLIRELGLDAVVRIRPSVPYPEALVMLQQADVLLLFAQGQPEQIPAKLYEYMHIGRCVLAFADGASARLLDEINLGYVVGAGESAEVPIEKVVRLARSNRLGGNSRDKPRLARYRADSLALTLTTMLNRLVDAPQRADRPSEPSGLGCIDDLAVVGQFGM